MLKIVGEGTLMTVEVQDGATLEEVLEAAGLEYDPNATYRSLNGEIGPYDTLDAEGVVVFAVAEDNGSRR